jgi:hypothetical protein
MATTKNITVTTTNAMSAKEALLPKVTAGVPRVSEQRQCSAKAFPSQSDSPQNKFNQLVKIAHQGLGSDEADIRIL